MSEYKTLGKILDDIIDEAVLIATENLGENITEAEKVEFSKEHERKMQTLFRKEHNKLILKKTIRYSKRVAVFFLVLIAASCVTIFSVEAWRIKVMNFIIEMNKTHSEINFGDANTGDAYTSDEITLAYIPEGFKLEKRDSNENSVNLIFKREDNYFVFSMDSLNGKVGIDTENASVKKTIINGKEALYSSNSNVNILVWHDEEVSYTLSGNIDEKEMIKIAKDIKK